MSDWIYVRQPNRWERVLLALSDALARLATAIRPTGVFQNGWGNASERD